MTDVPDTTTCSTVLFVDDDVPSTKALIRALSRQGAEYQPLTASSRSEALSAVSSSRPEAAIVDLCLDPALGPESGLALISELLELDQTLRILVLTGHGADEFGIRALGLGAASFLEKPADPAHLNALIQDACSFSSLKRRYLSLSSTPDNLSRLTGLSSKNEAMQEVIKKVAYAASHNQPVLLLGETGVGKGLIARAIHDASNRSTRAFIRFQPSFSSPDLVASELFGHRRGAFTGATEDRKGLVEDSNRGTLFVDEVGDLPHEVQVLLLEVIQERTFRRVGENNPRKSDFRLIAATNKRAEEFLEKGLLRRDFYHRIAHLTIEIPPLRERKEDISDLARFFAARLTNQEDIPVQGLTPEALVKLEQHTWPGNVRELQAVVEGGVYHAQFHERRFVETDDISLRKADKSQDIDGSSFREKTRRFELKLIREALQKCDNNQTKAAQLLDLDRSTLRRILSRSESD